MKILLLALLAPTLIAGCGTAVPAEADPCTVTQEEDGSATIACPDGTTANVAAGERGLQGEEGPAGEDGSSCSVTDNGDGIKTITCDDGSSTVLTDASCTITTDGDTKTITCDDGTSVTVVDGGLSIIVGDFTIENALDLAALAEVTTVTGDLIDATSGIELLEFPALETVGGDLIITSPDIASVSFPKLATVGREISFSEVDALSEINMPMLESIGVYLRFEYNDALTDFDLPALTSVGEALIVLDNPILPLCRVEALHDQLLAAGFTGWVTMNGNDETATCD